eukprot:scaffold131100_cov97-Cyclotella_meneghiniana.AAC.3
MASAANPTITSVPSQKMAITTSHTHRSQSSHKQKRGEEQPEAMWTIYFLIPNSTVMGHGYGHLIDST